MKPKTPYGWVNVIVRGYDYNEKTARYLDRTANPDPGEVAKLNNSISAYYPKNHRADSSSPDNILPRLRRGKRY